MDLELVGKRAIVTGGSRGIGLAVAKALSAEGAHVALVARDAATLEEARKAVTEAGGLAAGQVIVAGQPAVGAQLEVQRVRPVDEHEDRLQQVIAVRPLADDVQEEVELGRCGQVMDCLHRSLPARRAV